MIGEIEEASKEEDPEKLTGKVVPGEEKCERDDSGMDDRGSSASSACNADSEESDDDVVVRNPKRKALRIADDDLDSETSQDGLPESLPAKKGKSEMKTAEQALEAVLNADSESDSDAKFDLSTDEDSDENETLTFVIKKKKKPQLTDDSDNDEESHDTAFAALEDDEAAEHDDCQLKKSPLKLQSNDLFDADQSDSDNSDRGSDVGEEGEDEGFDESSVSQHLLKKLKKGASKKEKKPRTGPTRKAKQDDRMQIHSESQRLVRESRVSLPYHQPAPKSLQDFLARANKKQEEYKALKGTTNLKKARVLEDLLLKTRGTTILSDSKTAISSNDSPVLKEKTLPACINASECNDENIATFPEQSIGLEPTANSGTNLSDLNMDDYLPDLPSSVPGDIIIENSDNLRNIKDNTLSELSDSVKTNVVNHSATLTCSNNLADGSMSTNDDVVTDTSLPGDSVHMVETGKQKNNRPEVLNLDPSPEHAQIIDINFSEAVVMETETNVATPKLAAISSVDLNFTPSLSGEPLKMVDFNDGDNTPRNPGVAKLVERLMDHSQKKKSQAKDVEISIVAKEKNIMGEDELKVNTFTYHTEHVEEDPLMKLDQPGAKLVFLKEKLQTQMKIKREVARQKRQEIYDLDNEEGGYLGETSNEEEEEAEMTDASETDVEDDDFDEEFGDEEIDDEEEKVENPFMDDEAEEDESDKDLEMNLKLDVSDEEDESDEADDDDDDDEAEADDGPEEGEGPAIEKVPKKKLKVLAFSDDEESKSRLNEICKKMDWKKNDGDTIADQVEVRNFRQIGDDLSQKQDDKDTEIMSPFTKHIASVTPTQNVRRTSSLSLPIEDSQDLYVNTDHGNTPQNSKHSHFYTDDSQSQMLDADGFLRVQSIGKRESLGSNLRINTMNTQENMNELLGLCTGKFVESTVDDKKSSCKNLFGDSQEPPATQGMDELLGLCSGVFVDSSSKGQPNETSAMRADDKNQDLDEENSLHLLSDNDNCAMSSDKDGFSDEEEDCYAGDEVDGDAPVEERRKTKQEKFAGFTSKKNHGRIRKEFVDEEAELSGSEYDSDENLDLAEEDDIMEEELGDKDVLATEDELRNQVGRVHLKQLIDDDARQLMRFQEMYLPDGDLYSEGAGRQRKFKWRNIDDDTQQDMFDNDSNGEHPEDAAAEIKWRMERYEREKWLEDQQDKEAEEAGNSIYKFGKVFLKKKGSIECPAKKEKKDKEKETTAPSTPNTLFKQGNSKKGSFLSRSKASLAKIAEMSKGGNANPVGPRNSRNFVFQVLSPEKAVAEEKPKPVKKRTLPSSSQKPAAKKPRHSSSHNNPFSQHSIFHHI